MYSNNDTYAQQEAERLRRMAGVIDPISLKQIQSVLGSLEGLTILDVGAGDSTTLGDLIRSQGATYIPTDKRQGAVDVHLAAGFDKAAVADATHLPDISVDLVHARFVAGWLSSRQRQAMVYESLKRSNTLVITDYDWSTAHGPLIYDKAITLATEIMKGFGFRPDYGKRSENDIRGILTTLFGHDFEANGIHIRSTYVDPMPNSTLADALPLVAYTAESIRASMHAFGDIGGAKSVSEVLNLLIAYAQEHPDERVVLPSVVTTTVTCSDKARSAFKSELHGLYGALQRANDIIDIDGVDARLHDGMGTTVGRLLSAEGRDAARRVQAAAYYYDGIVADEAIDSSTAMLIQSNDPDSLAERSDYFAARKSNGRIGAVIRIIRPSDDGVKSLPIVERLANNAPLAYDHLLENGVLHDSSKVVEVSGLAKSALSGDHSDVVDIVVALVLHGVERGIEHAVMGLQEKHMAGIVAALGRDVVTHIPTSDAVHPVNLPGVDPNMKFVGLYVHIPSALPALRTHAANHPHSVLAKRLALFDK